jgi:hypothetical protein
VPGRDWAAVAGRLRAGKADRCRVIYRHVQEKKMTLYKAREKLLLSLLYNTRQQIV